jgi:hypothetical protein
VNLDSITLEMIKGFVESGAREDLHLEFKTVEDTSFSRGDRRNLATILSSFANADGGIIVWGVSARRNDEGIDAAAELKPMAKLAVFEARLQEYTEQAIDPPLPEIAHRVFSCGADQGFAVTYVPRSVLTPHMAKHGEDRYYKRSGASSYRMEHFDVTDMLGQRQRPSLRVVFGEPTYGNWNRVEVLISLKNEGRATAKFPYLAILAPRQFNRCEFGVDGNGFEGLARIHQRDEHGRLFYGSKGDIVIHPNTTLDVFRLRYQNAECPFTNWPIKISYDVCCENVPLQTGESEIR